MGVADTQCSRCFSTGKYLVKLPDRIGLYCSNCDKWIKWVNKKDFDMLARQGIPVREGNQSALPTNHTVNGVSVSTGITRNTPSQNNSTPVNNNRIKITLEYDINELKQKLRAYSSENLDDSAYSDPFALERCFKQILFNLGL